MQVSGKQLLVIKTQYLLPEGTHSVRVGHLDVSVRCCWANTALPRSRQYFLVSSAFSMLLLIQMLVDVTLTSVLMNIHTMPSHLFFETEGILNLACLTGTLWQVNTLRCAFHDKIILQ